MNSLKMWDKLNDILGQTPLHPQYFVIKEQKEILNITFPKLKGKVLDVGCGRQLLRKPITDLGCNYTSLDHPNIYRRQRAKEKPDILADITKLPLSNNSYNSVLLFMVLPHLPNPSVGIKEINRILKSNGLLFISAIENYPGHDLPDDYFRFRLKGLVSLCEYNGFKIIQKHSFGNFWIVNSLNFNVFLMQSAKFILDKTGNNFLTGVLIVLFMPFIIISNISAIILSPLDIIKTTKLVNFLIAKKDA